MKISHYVRLGAILPVLLGGAVVAFADQASRSPGEDGQAGQPPSLGAYGADILQTSVSGVSSGGAMAIQMHVAHSGIMRGVGVIAGVGYDCANSGLPLLPARLARIVLCLAGVGDANAPFSIARTTQATAVPGAIDPTSNLERQKVWLFSGYNDGSVRRAAMDAVAAYYEHYAAPGNVFYQIDNPAPHALVTDDYRPPCLGFNETYINNCNYDAAGYLLKHIYGHLNVRSDSPSGSVLAFSQSEFTGGIDPKSVGLAETGYVYVPTGCLAQNQQVKCRVHVVFHGCRQYAGNPAISKAVVERGGYNRWADTNHFIILYPQTTPTPITLGNPGNEHGCWDWWGYSDLPLSRDFARKNGYQISAVRAMIDRLAEGFVPGNASQPFGPPQDVSVSDRTSDSLALIWQPNAAAAGFSIARSTSAAGPFNPLADMVKGASFVDKGLTRDTLYHYQIRAVDASNAASAPVSISGRTLATMPPPCEPYFSSNRQHISAGRAYEDFFGNARALGSNDLMGEADDDVFSQLTREPGPFFFFHARYCP